MSTNLSQPAMIKAAILTFHNTPNYGATLQCYALSSYLRSKGANVEIINYMPPHAIKQYAKSLFLGKRRSIRNFLRVEKFYSFVRRNLKMSGPPIFRACTLGKLAENHYDVAFTGSDEVWKVDHMRQFDPAYYFSFLDPSRTKLVAYAATASTVTDLRRYSTSVTPLLRRFSYIGVRDRSTFGMVQELLGSTPTEVLDPTLIWDFGKEHLPPIHEKPYVAVYSWLDNYGMRPLRDFANKNGLEVVCVGCRHRDADKNYIGIGPEEWMRLIKHSSAVVTDFFHGILFSIIFERPFYAHVDEKKVMKIQQALEWVGLPHYLQANIAHISDLRLHDISPDWSAVKERLAPLRAASMNFIDSTLLPGETLHPV